MCKDKRDIGGNSRMMIRHWIENLGIIETQIVGKSIKRIHKGY